MITEFLSPPVQKNYRSDIDGLRALAVGLVVAFHTFPSFFKGGFIGVDIFFVISGYLISGIIFKGLEEGTFSFKEFYLRRIKRIFPALILVFIASFIWGFLFFIASELALLTKHIIAGVLFVSNIVYWFESGYFDSGTKYLLHLWSLGIEEQFYIAWPLLVYLIYRVRKFLLVSIVFFLLASFTLNILIVSKDAVSAFFLPYTRFWELLIGSLLAYSALAKQDKSEGSQTQWLNHSMSFFGLFLIVVSFLVIDKNRDFPGWWALLPTCGTYLLISAGSKAFVNRTVLSNPLFVFIGLISYPMYLWHLLILSISKIIYADNEFQATIIPILADLLSLILSILTYKIVEIPIRFEKRKHVASALIVAMILILAVASFGFYKNGFPERFPKIVSELDKINTFDYKPYFRNRTCLLEDQNTESFSPDCLDNGNNLLIFIWGDSYAAHLVHGLNTLKSERNIRIAQYTSAACFPILDLDNAKNPNCKSINGYIGKELIPKVKPELVILSAYWLPHNFQKYDFLLRQTILHLKESGIKKIILIGPFPDWEFGLPNFLIRRIIFERATDVPQRLKSKSNLKATALDEKFRNLTTEAGILYISPLRELCNLDGCMTRTSQEVESLFSFDHGHLTPKGSEYFVRKIFPKLEEVLKIK